MKNKEENIMTQTEANGASESKPMSLPEAKTLLENVLISLAKNSVHNKRLLEYADELERYITILERQEKDGDKSKAN